MTGRNIILLYIIVLCAVMLPLSAQEEQPEEDFAPTLYQLGDQVFNINLGLFIPMWYRNPGDFSTADTNLSLGGTGSLEYATFIDSQMSLGLSLKGMFAYTPTDRLLSMFPITAKYTYYLLDAYPFEFPLFIHGGLCISRLEQETYYGPTLMPGAGVIWNMSSSWGFGLNATYWWVPMWYGADNERAAQSRFGNFLDVSLSASYHF